MTFARLSTALLFLGIACAACFMPAQNDTWWQMRAGEEILRLRTVPLRDSFSHTAYGAYWPDHEWLSQVVLYALYRVGGPRLLTAVLAALVTVTWILVWRLTPGSERQRLILIGLALAPSSLAWSLRPQVFTLFFLALTVFLVTRRRLSWLPLVFLVWANFHGAVLLGLVVMIATTAGSALVDWRECRRLASVTLLCVIATSMTPLGLSFWNEMILSLGRINQYQISEWRAPRFTEPVFLPFWILTLVLLGLVATHKPWRSPACLRDPVVTGSLALLPLAMRAERNVAPLLLLAVPAIAMLMAGGGGRPGPIGTERPSLNMTVLATAVVVAVGSVAYAWTREIDRLQWNPMSSKAIDAVASCPERLYNRYDDGGYLIWFVRNQRVFLDGRQDPYPPELIAEQLHVERSGEYEPTFEAHDIRCAFIPRDSLLAHTLESAGWQTTYRDATHVVMAAPAVSAKAETTRE